MGATSFVPRWFRPYTSASSNKSLSSPILLSSQLLTRLGNVLYELPVRIGLWNKVFGGVERTAIVVSSPVLGCNPRSWQVLFDILGYLFEENAAC